MEFLVFKFLASSAIIVIAGSFLTGFADRLGEMTGLGRVLAGSILIASATSLPELMVDLKAISINAPDLAVGDLLGSSLFNLLILATLDFSFPSAFRRTTFSPNFLHHSLSAVICILLTSLVGIGIITRLDLGFLNIGLFVWLILIVYLFGLRLVFFNKDNHLEAEQQPNVKFRFIIKDRTFQKALAGYLFSAVVIIFTAPHLTTSADELAKSSGLSQTFIGTCLVALSTSLPELVSTLAAFRLGAPDLALGNIFGSNTFNMILLLPLDFVFSGVLLSSVRPIHAVTAFCIVAVTSMAVIGQLYRKKERTRFAEPSSEIIVIMIIVSLFLNYHLGS